MFAKAQLYAKFIAAMLGAVLSGGALLIPDDVGKWIAFVIALLTAFSVYRIPNATPDQSDSETDSVTADTSIH